MKETALQLLASGLQPMPIWGPNDHGQAPKKPRISWSALQVELLTPAQVDLHPYRPEGWIGIVCGEVSGGLEVVDVDVKNDPARTIGDRYLAALRERAPELLSRLVIQRTGSGGLHLLFRCPGHIEGNLKLTALKGSKEAVLETRGEGGYIVASPTPGYSVDQGSLLEVPTITPEERALLFEVARSFDERTKEERTAQAEGPRRERVPREGGAWIETPLDHYNREGDVLALLERHGWRYKGRKGDRVLLQRPGKPSGSSDTSGNFHEGLRLLWVWSSSSSFPQEVPLSPVDVFAHLEMGLALPVRDTREVYQRLRTDGWGEKRERENPFDTHEPPPAEGSPMEENTPPKEAQGWTLEALLEDLRNVAPSKPTGWEKLDPHFQLRPGGLALVGAMPGGGKSLFLVNLLRQLALQYPHETFVYYSAEMKARELFLRLVQACTFQGEHRRARWIPKGQEGGAYLDTKEDGSLELQHVQGADPGRRDGWIRHEGKLLEELFRRLPKGGSFEELVRGVAVPVTEELRVNPSGGDILEKLKAAQEADRAPLAAFAEGYKLAAELITSGRVVLVDSPEQVLLVEEIEEHAKSLPNLGGIMIDYATRLSCKKAEKEREMRLRVLATSKELCRAALALGVPVVLAAQIGRDAHGTEGRVKLPKLEGKEGVPCTPPKSHYQALLPVVPDGDKLAESSQFFQDADAVLYISNPFHGGGVHEENPFLEMYREEGEGPLFLKVAKQRGGESGGLVELGYVPHGQTLHGLVQMNTFKKNPLKEGPHQPPTPPKQGANTSNKKNKENK